MNRVLIDLEALQHNIGRVNTLMAEHGASWSLVTKVLCGHSESLQALGALGVRSIADSRIANLTAARELKTEFETWYLRLPHMSAIGEIVAVSDVTLNSEIATIEALNAEAATRDKRHGVIIMIELGDLREGVLPGALVGFYRRVFELENIEVLGIGANLGCLSGTVPNIDQFMQLILYRELLELKFEHELPLISAGTSVVLPLLQSKTLPKSINHFRIGEAVFLGTDLVNGGTLPGFRSDAITVEAEIVELREKSLVPVGELSAVTPFESLQTEDEISPGQRGQRAIVTLGQLDTEVQGLTPIAPGHVLAGATSDLTVVNVGGNPGELEVGQSIRFRPNYGATLRLMTNRYMEKVLVPPLGAFMAAHDDGSHAERVPSVLDGLLS